MKKDTNTLQSELAEAPSLKQFLEDNDSQFQIPGTVEILQAMIAERKLKKNQLAERAHMSEVYLHQILSGSRRPSRNRLLCLCIGMQAGVEETQELLKRSGQAILYSRSRRDAVILYGLLHQLSLTEINDQLFDAGEDALV